VLATPENHNAVQSSTQNLRHSWEQEGEGKKEEGKLMAASANSMVARMFSAGHKIYSLQVVST
jgi:hypothetical protein